MIASASPSIRVTSGEPDWLLFSRRSHVLGVSDRALEWQSDTDTGKSWDALMLVQHKAEYVGRCRSGPESSGGAERRGRVVTSQREDYE